MNKQNRNRPIDTENKLVFARGEEYGPLQGGMVKIGEGH